jgi:hypothetical protein
MGVLVASAQTSSAPVATNAHNNYTSRVSTDNEIREMANKLELNEANYIRFRDLSRARNEQLREANNMYANDAAGLKKRVQTINKEFENQLAQTFSQKQYTAFLELQGRVADGIGSQAAGYGGSSFESNAATGTSTNGGAVNNANDANKPHIMGNSGHENGKVTGEKRKSKMKKRNKDK